VPDFGTILPAVLMTCVRNRLGCHEISVPWNAVYMLELRIIIMLYVYVIWFIRAFLPTSFVLTSLLLIFFVLMVTIWEQREGSSRVLFIGFLF
jgi:hypothetical protein